METLFNDILLSFVNNAYVYGGIIFTIILTLYFSYMGNIFNIQNKNNQVLIIFIFLLLLLFFYFLYNREKNFDKKLNIFTDDDEKIKANMGIPLFNFFSKVGILLGSFILGILLISFLLWSFNHFIALQYVWNLLLTVNFVVSIFAIIYFFFQNEINKIINYKSNELNIVEKIAKFLVELVFLIPCLFVIFLDIIKHEIKTTIPTVWIILIIEIILILLFFLIPFLFTHLNVHDGKVLLKGPVYLNKKYQVGTYQNVQKNKFFKDKIEEYKVSLFKDHTDYSKLDLSGNLSDNTFEIDKPMFNIKADLIINNKDKSQFEFKYNYGISFFLYLNPQPTNTSVAYVKDTVIFDYDSKPKIVFNGINQNLKFICEDSQNLEKEVYSTNDIKFQKWMHIVVNYYSGSVDIFIDGTLRMTKNDLAPFMDYSKIYVGSIDGINGGIRDVTYFSNPLPLNKIKFLNSVIKREYN